jgi:hypothetical protein
VTATSPCSLGVVGFGFLARTRSLSSLNFINFGITSLGSAALLQSGVVTLDLGGLQLMSLGNNAFCACKRLTSVTATVPCALGVVGFGFLANTAKLSSFSFHNIRIAALGDGALAWSGVVSLDLGGLQLTSLDDNALDECRNLTSVTAMSPCSLGAVGDALLSNTPNLSSFSFHNISIATLGDDALASSGVASLDLGGLQLTSLGNNAFAECRNLTSVTATAPCTLGVVGFGFLAKTTKLCSFTFHNISVASIGSNMLHDSGVTQVDVGGIDVTTTIGETTCPNLARVIASAPTTVTHFAGHSVERQ